jgi:hypothetical protein
MSYVIEVDVNSEILWIGLPDAKGVPSLVTLREDAAVFPSRGMALRAGAEMEAIMGRLFYEAVFDESGLLQPGVQRSRGLIGPLNSRAKPKR